MTKQASEIMKLNFMTDQGSKRDTIRWAWRALAPPPFLSFFSFLVRLGTGCGRGIRDAAAWPGRRAVAPGGLGLRRRGRRRRAGRARPRRDGGPVLLLGPRRVHLGRVRRKVTLGRCGAVDALGRGGTERLAGDRRGRKMGGGLPLRAGGG